MELPLAPGLAAPPPGPRPPRRRRTRRPPSRGRPRRRRPRRRRPRRLDHPPGPGHSADEIALLCEEHRAEARVWLAFVARAAVSETLVGPLRNSYSALHDLLVRLVTEVVASGLACLTLGASPCACKGHL
ncbi:TetR family transcriptional regulator C-terminal domain-containing protein [Streptomyces sp. NPDC093105]|uniref:TetR family transcriptional regulator C-terminal domain-containing protein n=1 Tax=Streptomyces sp. NPDC093105 TaxID=3366029 RepID=UPI003828D82D